MISLVSRPAFRGAFLPLCLAVAAAAPALGQSRGDYMNVESVQVSPLALAQLDSGNYLLACNTPDDAVELWSTDESIVPAANRFLDRLEVGLEPVSVLVVGHRFWTVNFLGDSVTSGEFVESDNGVELRLLNTRNLPPVAGMTRGDEPVDLAFVRYEERPTLIVSLFSGSAVAWIDADTLLPISANPPAYTVRNAGDPPLGLKEPRSILVRGDRVFVLGTKGGVRDPNSLHDLDLLSAAVADPLTFDRQIPAPNQGSLGTTNFNMVFSTAGDLYVVGAEAQNFNTVDKLAIRSEPTGFVRSMFYRVTGPGTAAPVVLPRDLNRTSTNAIVLQTGPEGRPASQPTDLALLENVDGEVEKVYISAMGSDRIVVLTVPAGGLAANPNPANWVRSTIDLPATTPGSSPMHGPRGLVLGQGTTGQRLWVLNRLDNSVTTIDVASDTVLPAASFALAFDPTPAHVLAGRPFLYDARISGTGFVSCASCHVDARTDALVWRLGTQGPDPLFSEPPPTAAFIESIAGTGTFGSAGPGPVFPFGLTSDPDFLLAMRSQQTFDPTLPDEGVFAIDDKREMVTQSLQGLLNYDVPASMKWATENAPYHWRGDKPSFLHFNEAFVTLMLAPNLGPANDPAGLSAADMEAFEDYVFSIVYPPNPQQPKDRVYSASDDSRNFAGGAEGLREFHEFETILGQRSCSHCHPLPEGSNNRLTVFVPDFPITGFIQQFNRQPIESAAMRGLLQKEPLLEPDGNFIQNPATTPRLGHFGLNHNGVQPLTGPPDGGPVRNVTSINTFIDLFFATGGPNPPNSQVARAVKQFAHEIDWGVGPMVGEVFCIDYDMLVNPARTAELGAQIAIYNAIVAQADNGNASAVLWLHRPNQANPADQTVGYRWYGPLTLWVEEPTYAGFTPAGILALMTSVDDRLIGLSTPLGNERRIAGTGGSEAPPAIPATAPSGIQLQTMEPNTANQAIPTFVANWSPNIGTTGTPIAPPGAPVGLPTADLFNFITPDSAFNPTVDEVFLQLMRLYQYGLMKGTGAASYGVPRLRHEAPRRLRLSGDNLFVGAVLLIDVPNPPSGYAGPPPSQPAGQASIPTIQLRLPLHPTTSTDTSGRTIWETAVELEPIVAYQLMNGWLGAPGVSAAIQDVFDREYLGMTTAIQEPTTGSPPFAVSSALPFDPDNWNWHGISVQNPVPTGSTPAAMTSSVTWQQLRM